MDETPEWELPGRFAQVLPRVAGVPTRRSRGRDGVVPVGWPRQVRPPGAPGWEDTAVTWLFDLCPPGYRSHAVLHRFPVVLARMTHQHVSAAVAAARHGYGTARADLSALAPPSVLAAVLRMYEHEGTRAAATERAVGLVEEALGGTRWEPRL
ncbi:hypothetical protein [Embleya sp. NPDC059237]|uniref:hypothetical protein n=1 Tax=Embleya sp. NPDC059237 TaxID=3346784 RepID=UPI003684AC4A